MAGGIFVDQPFHFNPKCVIFGIILMVAYYFLPPKELILLPLIFIFGYIAMAWYDHLYNCDTRLKSGTFPVGMATLDAWGKPDESNFDKEEDLKEGVKYVDDQVLIKRRNINYFHIFGVMITFVGFALWVNYVFNDTRKNNPDVSEEEIKKLASERLIGFRTFIGLFGVAAIAYHSYRLFVKQRPLRDDDNPEYMAGVNMLHLVIGSFMLYIAIDTTVQGFNYLGIMGIFAGAFHGFLLLTKNKE